ncbi:hypothetical protein QBC35DRAFT_107599 [Podospora australis]|uniref:U6 snRNA phosphodiesterase n=1 Tax=Podospora australis TaxID=1536484 RepID=A0AAN6X5W7_9PEZI|nr:hypothetical protein QBC35DRAFT_107599 [Podospora australis]
MALVDYTSDTDSSSSSSSSDSPPAKKPRIPETRHHRSGPSPVSSVSRAGSGSLPPQTTTTPQSSLPPLPSTFHDLYASTVRTTTTDSPALHQGRQRQTPHIPGNWPSHLYIEYHPPSSVSGLLTALISSLSSSSEKENISTFLQNDLGVPLPLHISLSRPLSLTTQQKDGFLSDVSTDITKTGIKPFDLTCTKAEWHHTSESGRSFLVLRVTSSSSSSSSGETNKELSELLKRCNATCKNYDQPELYSWALLDASPDDDEEEDKKKVGNAFHVSIAWSFAKPTDELVQLTEKVFGEEKVATQLQEQVKIHVDGIKAKIGNVVTHIPLPQPGKRKKGDTKSGGRSILGL